jgi:hypothetical protein
MTADFIAGYIEPFARSLLVHHLVGILWAKGKGQGRENPWFLR